MLQLFAETEQRAAGSIQSCWSEVSGEELACAGDLAAESI